MSTMQRPRASFGVAKKNIPGVLKRANMMYEGFLANVAMLGSPPIAVTAFLALITALTTVQQSLTGTRARGLATLRNTKRDLLWTAMESLQTYVQGLCDALTAEGAASLIQAAGLVVAGTPVLQKPVLAATLTTTPGDVHLACNRSLLVGKADAHKRVMFSWQWSSDGKTWNSVTSTPYASTIVQGLTALTTYSFRVSVTIGTVAGAWSQPVSLLVH